MVRELTLRQALSYIYEYAKNVICITHGTNSAMPVLPLKPGKFQTPLLGAAGRYGGIKS